MPEQKSDELLRVLLDANVEFVVVGGIAAVAHGMDRSTKDLDVLLKMTAGNVARLLAALQPYHPKHLLRQDLGVIPIESSARLATFDFILLTTTIGRLDVLGTVEPVGRFADVEQVRLELFPGRSVAVLALEQLVAVKMASGRPRDLQDAHELRALLELSQAARPEFGDSD